MQKNPGYFFVQWPHHINVDNTLMALPTGEDTISKIMGDTVITTEYSGIVIYASGLIQGSEESIAIMSAFNFDETDTPKRTEGAITNNSPIPRQLNISRVFDFEPMF